MLLVNAIISLIAGIFCVLSVLRFTVFVSTQTKNTVLTIRHEGAPPEVHIDHVVEKDLSVLEVVWPLLWDVMLMLVFVVQHSLMATQWWKDTLSDLAIVTSQRALYIIATCWALKLIMSSTSVIPLPALWFINTDESFILWLVFFLIHLVAWLVLYATCIVMDFPEMIGCRQVYYQYLGCEPPLMHKSSATRRLYSHMRHGGATCLLVVLWVHPMMTATRIVMATLLSWYLLWGFSVCGQDYVYLREQISRKHITFRTSRVRTIELLQ